MIRAIGAVLVIALAACLSGCGGGSDGSASGPATGEAQAQAEGGEDAAVRSAVQEYLDAFVAEDWASACERLAAVTIEELTASADGGCESVLASGGETAQALVPLKQALSESKVTDAVAFPEQGTGRALLEIDAGGEKEGIVVGLVDEDGEWRLVDSNPSAEGSLGVSPEEALEEPQLSPAELANSGSHLYRVVAIDEGDCSTTTKAGELIPVTVEFFGDTHVRVRTPGEVLAAKVGADRYLERNGDYDV
ncbi:MAG TPA: hypothetical protein VG518_10340, partial [Solirubrobacterales bacterium]|nr:hypothetical protein [Solirubrobacterales bacterium]